VKVTGRYYVHNLDEELNRIKLLYEFKLSTQPCSQEQLQQPQQSCASDRSNNTTTTTAVAAAAADSDSKQCQYGNINLLSNALNWPLVVTQSTPSPWTLYDGVTRTEVVGFHIKSMSSLGLFEGQDESVGRPMERVLFEKCRHLLLNNNSTCCCNGGSKIIPLPVVASFAPLLIDPTRNAENDVNAVL
jgi:hypothetical protein